MKRLDFYKFYSMISVLFLEIFILTVASLNCGLVFPIFIVVLFLELVKANLSVQSIEDIERTGEVKPIYEKADFVLMCFNSFLVSIAVIVATVTHFLG